MDGFGRLLGSLGSLVSLPLSSSYGVTLLVTICALFLSWYFLFRTRSSSKDTVLLVGLSGSGKTHMFFRLLLGREMDRRFYTSMEMNEDTFAIHESLSPSSGMVDRKQVRIVDCPGHGRLRQEVHRRLPTAAAVVVVVDANSASRDDISNLASFLFDILSVPEIAYGDVPILFACSKSDLVMALPPRRLQDLVAAELDQVVKTQSALPSDIAGSSISEQRSRGAPAAIVRRSEWISISSLNCTGFDRVVTFCIEKK